MYMVYLNVTWAYFIVITDYIKYTYIEISCIYNKLNETCNIFSIHIVYISLIV